jgi:hypothetical protein
MNEEEHDYLDEADEVTENPVISEEYAVSEDSKIEVDQSIEPDEKRADPKVKQTVGFITAENYQALVTIGELEIHATKKKCPMSKYADLKKGGDLFHFKFDPFTGERIDWMAMKEFYEEKE